MIGTFPVGPPLPSLPYLCEYFFRLIGNHPLIANPVVRHPLTDERVYIERYKLYNGIETEEGLACSIFPHSTPTDGLSLPKPAEVSTSALFGSGDDPTLGVTVEDVIYHIGIKLHYACNIKGNLHPSDPFRTLPVDAAIHPSHELKYDIGTKVVPVNINPGIYIIGEYMELIRLAIHDRNNADVKRLMDVPYHPKRVEVLYFNLKTAPWEKDRSVYFHEGEILIRIDDKVSKGWRSRFNKPATCTTLTIERS